MSKWRKLEKDEKPPSHWHKVWIAGPIFGMPDEYLFKNMMEWCSNNSTFEWTTHWYQDNMAICFESIDDSTLFKMVWQ